MGIKEHGKRGRRRKDKEGGGREGSREKKIKLHKYNRKRKNES